ncbi:GNAT family N-acetyltransferase [Yoonia sp. 208BN28-4]|uniref:GNAT family N-acetyltransferase n=1 Tax=Yoonia sp. 208BN28-4 TaxID=3126505 RepID=UPI0030A71832
MIDTVTQPMSIRPEVPADYPFIYDLTMRAFAPMAFGDGTEAGSIDRMRDQGELALSLVAEEEGKVIGHIAFSPAGIPNVRHWYGLGPISVELDRQRQGIGSSLASEGLRQLRDRGAHGVVLIGNPRVYGPMGFVSNGQLSFRDVPAEIVQFVHFEGPEPAGEVTFAKGLEG